MKFVYRLWLSFCAFAVILSGCIKEDLEICFPQPVNTSFIFVPSAYCAEETVVPDDIRQLTLFLFDENGRFVQQVDTIPIGVNYQIELIPASYQFVAVAGFHQDQLLGVPFVPRQTHIQDAMVTTYFEQLNGSLHAAEHALYLGTDTLTVLPESPGQELMLTLIQRTKALNITVGGVTGEMYQVALAGNAAQYTFNGEQIYLTGNPLVHVPLQEGEDGTKQGKTLINWPLKDNGDYTRLQIINPVTGGRLIDEELYELLQRVPGLNPDCASSFDVDIHYAANRSITIFINDWKVFEDGYILI